MIVNFLRYVSYYNDYRIYVDRNPDCDNKNLVLSWIFLINTLMSILLSGIVASAISLGVTYGMETNFIELFMLIAPYLIVIIFISVHSITILCEMLLYLIKKFRKK